MTGVRFTRAARERYGLTTVELPEQVAQVRRLLATVQRASVADSGLRDVHAGQLHAAGLITAALSLVVDRYDEDVARDVFARALVAVGESLGQGTVDRILAAYEAAFGRGPGEAPAGPVQALREVLFVWLANVNPAFGPMRELFDDAELRATDGYERLITSLASFFAQQTPFGPDHQPLIAMLRSPAVAFPDSLQGQLAYIRDRWGALLGDLLDRLLMGMGVLNEEERAMWLRIHGGGALAGQAGTRPGAGMAVYDFRAYQDEREAFTPDRDWHPRLVLLAKSVYVWLDQLSRTYGRHIQRLDQIPEEELDRMAAWGMTGLWLIGIWQRSRASEQIKRIRGNPDAAASAYALDEYRVADDLGGEEAWTTLSERAGQRGLKLAADMVPNHMGVDSRWVIEHPEWFLSLSEPPYPGYSYNGPELSPDPDVSIKIEDHYWDGTDAAVVFRRQDHRSGDTRYIYHGNDGTVMPWNDTAQLNYIDANVREQVIQTILAVARRFPVIRFDAAMVLTRQHMRRLWWPEPGSGGAIPSRSERSISAAAFDQAMPGEFWREVVDRVAAEGLDTLLLAEAFWLLEGYFVRTLGMHRVYNSAFMNMLRDERNAEYHLVMRNTLEFDPEVLKRFVNFMSNPDEDTAVDQFGKGDKYFGICTLLATLPGLPMFGHGQIEGFAEKYGMEYRRAYYDETADQELVARHEQEIFPLLRRRAQFAEVRDFLLYPFETDGGVNEDVFAYSNGQGAARSLIMYHNAYASTAGVVRQSVQFIVKDGEARHLVSRSLADGLGLSDAENAYLTFRDAISGLEYVRAAREIRERGIWVELGAYRRNVFLDFEDVYDGPAGLWRRLAERLGGRGVPSLAEALDGLVLESVQAPFRRMVSPASVKTLVEATSDVDRDRLISALLQDADQLGRAAAELSGGEIAPDHDEALAAVDSGLRAILHTLATETDDEDRSDALVAGALLSVVAVRALGGPGLSASARARYVEEWRLTPIITSAFRDLGADDSYADELTDAVRASMLGIGWAPGTDETAEDTARRVLAAWLDHEVFRHAMAINQYDGVVWFGAEAFGNLVRVTRAVETMRAREAPEPLDSVAGRRAEERIELMRQVADMLVSAAEASGYRVDALREALSLRPAATSANTSDDENDAQPASAADDNADADSSADPGARKTRRTV